MLLGQIEGYRITQDPKGRVVILLSLAKGFMETMRPFFERYQTGFPKMFGFLIGVSALLWWGLRKIGGHLKPLMEDQNVLTFLLAAAAMVVGFFAMCVSFAVLVLGLGFAVIHLYTERWVIAGREISRRSFPLFGLLLAIVVAIVVGPSIVEALRRGHRDFFTLSFVSMVILMTPMMAWKAGLGKVGKERLVVPEGSMLTLQARIEIEEGKAKTGLNKAALPYILRLIRQGGRDTDLKFLFYRSESIDQMVAVLRVVPYFQFEDRRPLVRGS